MKTLCGGKEVLKVQGPYSYVAKGLKDYMHSTAYPNSIL